MATSSVSTLQYNPFDYSCIEAPKSAERLLNYKLDYKNVAAIMRDIFIIILINYIMITISRISTGVPTVICTHVYISLCIRSLKFNGSGLHPGNGAKTKHNCDRAYIQRNQFLN